MPNTRLPSRQRTVADGNHRVGALRGIHIVRGDQSVAPQPLLPPDAFPDTRPDPVEREAIDGIPAAETGPNSRSVRTRLASSCAGWPVPPNAAEFFAAVRTTRPTVRDCAIVRAWAHEATSGEVMRGWLEGAYTWPILVAALHRTDAGHGALNALLNGFAKAEWVADQAAAKQGQRSWSS